jgi:hypothetical protein
VEFTYLFPTYVRVDTAVTCLLWVVLLSERFSYSLLALSYMFYHRYSLYHISGFIPDPIRWTTDILFVIEPFVS